MLPRLNIWPHLVRLAQRQLRLLPLHLAQQGRVQLLVDGCCCGWGHWV